MTAEKYPIQYVDISAIIDDIFFYHGVTISRSHAAIILSLVTTSKNGRLECYEENAEFAIAWRDGCMWVARPISYVGDPMSMGRNDQ